jgi:hypothetical protein
MGHDYEETPASAPPGFEFSGPDQLPPPAPGSAPPGPAFSGPEPWLPVPPAGEGPPPGPYFPETYPPSEPAGAPPGPAFSTLAAVGDVERGPSSDLRESWFRRLLNRLRSQRRPG